MMNAAPRQRFLGEVRFDETSAESSDLNGHLVPPFLWRLIRSRA